MLRVIVRSLRVLACAATAAATSAHAAGGAHLLDDSEVGQLGQCQLESWGTRLSGDRWTAVAAPACTLAAPTPLELSAFMARSDAPGSTSIGAGIKVALASPVSGIGLAVSGGLGWGGDGMRLESGNVILPISSDVSPGVRISANLGWEWSRSGDRHSGLAGAQVEARVARRWSLMSEAVVRDSGRTAFQGGVRWTPADWVDVDLLAGRFVDGSSPRALSIGVTLRGRPAPAA